MHYRKIWEQYHNSEIPNGSEIHHIDGNRNNNDPNNLKLVTIDEHLNIHKSQKDWGAVQAILLRMSNMPDRIEQISQAASKHQRKLINEGRHNFQLIPTEMRSKISREVGYKTKKELKGIHKINADPKLAYENARRGGLSSAAKSAGFLDTKSIKHGSKAVAATFWWTNIETNERKRSKISPGEDWKRGMSKMKGRLI